jgi:hypothetical protein
MLPLVVKHNGQIAVAPRYRRQVLVDARRALAHPRLPRFDQRQPEGGRHCHQLHRPLPVRWQNRFNVGMDAGLVLLVELSEGCAIFCFARTFHRAALPVQQPCQLDDVVGRHLDERSLVQQNFGNAAVAIIAA